MEGDFVNRSLFMDQSLILNLILNPTMYVQWTLCMFLCILMFKVSSITYKIIQIKERKYLRSFASFRKSITSFLFCNVAFLKGIKKET